MVVRCELEFQLRFGDVGCMLKCRVQAAVRGFMFRLNGFKRRSDNAPVHGLFKHTLVPTISRFTEIVGVILCP